MLKYEDNPKPPPAAEARVKTEEFAHAVATLEARRAEELRRLEGTVVLGQAVSDLQLEVTPEELLVEVERNRRAELNGRLEKSSKTYWFTLRERRFTWRTIGLMTSLGFISGWLLKTNILYVQTPMPAVKHPLSNQVVVPSVQSPAVSALAQPSSLPSPPPPIWQGLPLSQFPDDQQVYTTATNLTNLPGAYNPGVSQFAEDANSTGGRVWPLIKHNGIIYVRGWVLDQPTSDYLAGHYVVLGSSRDAIMWTLGRNQQLPKLPHEITFRMDKGDVDWKPGTISAGGWQTVSVKGATLDSHAWEKW